MATSCLRGQANPDLRPLFNRRGIWTNAQERPRAAVGVPYFLGKHDPGALRDYLTAAAPETRDTEFVWKDFIEHNDSELLATWGNLPNARGYSGSC
jgi:hypothetical protein